LRVEPGRSATVTMLVHASRRKASNLDADSGAARLDFSAVRVDGDDPRLQPTLATGLDDLRHLALTDPEAPDDVFAAAGTPWYLTLFGRDSLWAARMVLPFGTDLAAGTLRTLARRQGRAVDEGRAEAPGKIPHELRRTAYADGGLGLALPPVYYGTIDATPLWVNLLHDAWRWGMAESEVEALLPNLRAAVRWLTDFAAPDEDGLLKYIDRSGTGLANQGWKDSGDSVRWRDGRIAEAPIALAEAQAYAIEAAESAAALYEAFGQQGAGELREWAEAMRVRFRARFWVEGPDGPYVGIAVDGRGATVDGVGSNMGHVLGTGTVTPQEAARIAATLTSATMLDRYGVATLASDNGGYNPIGYHTGSVWTHDTAICAWGLAREGHRQEAAAVGRSLLASAAAFGYRWPELYAGSGVLDQPAPYPASCRPQAWSAASAAALVSVALGFAPDAPAGRLTLRPARPAAYGSMTVRGLRFAGHPFGVRVAADGAAEILDAPDAVEVTVA
jgi:glycogen debranching enzyme